MEDECKRRKLSAERNNNNNNNNDDSNLTAGESIILRELRKMEKMEDRAKYVVSIFWVSDIETFISLLEKEPSIAFESQQKSLLHYICSCPQFLRKDLWWERLTLERKVLWGRMVWKVWDAYPEAVDDDPSIFHHITKKFKGPSSTSISASGPWLEVLGKLCERCPELAAEASCLDVTCSWARCLPPHSNRGRDSIFETYPRMIQTLWHITMLYDDIDVEVEEGDNEDDNKQEDDLSANVSGVGGYGDLTQLVGWVQSIRCKRLDGVLEQVTRYTRITTYDMRESGLSIYVVPREIDPSSNKPNSIDNPKSSLLVAGAFDSANDVLPLFVKHNVPIGAMHCTLFSIEVEYVGQLMNVLAICKIEELKLSCGERCGCKAADRVFQGIAAHPMIRRLELAEIDLSAEGNALPSLALLVNLKQLTLMGKTGFSVFEPSLVKLLDNTRRLKNLVILSRPSTRTPLECPHLCKALGRSKSLRVFETCSLFRPCDLRPFLHALETSNTTLQLVWPWRRSPHSDPVLDNLLFEIEYYCDLNWIGRRRIREVHLCREEIVVHMVSRAMRLARRKDGFRLRNEEGLERATSDRRRERGGLEVTDDTYALSLVYGLLRENPPLWSMY